MKATQPSPRSILSLDMGKKRIGLAGCDALGITVSPLPALHRVDFNQDLKKLQEHCKSRNVEGLVVGLPLDCKGMPTNQALHCERYGYRIAKALHLPLAWVNEHSSSWTAAERHNLQGDRSGQLDSAAAALLLEQWLREGPELKPVNMAAPKLSKVNSNSGS